MKRGDIPKVFTPEDVLRRLGNLKQEIQAIRTMNNGLTKVNEEIKEFVNLVIGDTESQVITTWFFSGTPTSSNKPEEDWETNEEKQKHLGDLYYDKETGYAYKYVFENNIYSWQKQNNSISNALSIANSSPDSGDNKRIICTNTPSPPYNTGDIWINDSGNILRCRASRESGNFSQVDWCTLDEYKDDFYYQNIEAVLNQLIEDVQTNYATKVSLETTKDSINARVSSETTKITARFNDYTKTEQVEKQLKTVEDKITDSERKIVIINETLENGISKIRTEKGYTFNDDGLNIESSNSNIKNVLNENGMSIKEKEENLLFAGYDTEKQETIVKTRNILVDKYLSAPHIRIEKYNNPTFGEGTGFFYIE